MSTNKLLLNHGVLTKGNGSRRVVLCYDSGLIYQYADPSNILGIYSAGQGWVVLQKSYYHQGGWGSGSTGNAEGHYLISNARELVDAIGGTVLELNSKAWLTPKELAEVNRAIETNNKLIKQHNEIAKRLNRKDAETELNPIETYKVTRLGRYGRADTTLKGQDVIAVARRYETAVQVFIQGKGKPIKIDTYSISKDVVKQGETVVAFRDATGQVFMNSQVLDVSRFERNFMGNQSMIQSEIRAIAKYSIPFNVLASANLKLSETRVLEQGPESTHQIKDGGRYGSLVERHFTGALLLENKGRKFLMDIDRVEIEHKLFNAFFVEVSPDVKSIAEAYESMKPQAVRDAELAGTEVKRQGEWFFIATDKSIEVRSDYVLNWPRDASSFTHDANPQYVLKRAVAHGKGRPNNLYKPIGFGDLDQLVCGTVSHQGREHADLDLGQEEVTSSGNGDRTTFKLWQLVPNTTVSNFTITGDID
jgi:hypothetical protein